MTAPNFQGILGMQGRFFRGFSAFLCLNAGRPVTRPLLYHGATPASEPCQAHDPATVFMTVPPGTPEGE